MELCRFIDHAVLKPQYTQKEVLTLIQEGIDCRVFSVCVRPSDIEQALVLTRGTETCVSVVLGFPHGCGHSRIKAQEAEFYSKLGVSEIDMVAHYGLVRSGEYRDCVSDIQGVVRSAGPRVPVKVILETSELDDRDIELGVRASMEAGAQYVKTSTGFASGGASEHAVSLMLEYGKGKILVKASGGIRDAGRAQMFLDMGVSRLGVGAETSAALCQGHKVGGQDQY